MQRRHFLSLVGTGTLAACTGTTVAPGPTMLDTVVTDVSAIADGLVGIAPIIDTIPGLSATTIAQINATIANLQVLAAQIKTVNTTIDAQPIVVQIETDLNTIVTALAHVSVLPPPISIALQSASILLPIIEASVNLMTPPKLAAHAKKVQLTPDQARHILRDLAKY